MKTPFITALLITLSWSLVNGQTAEDALRFSRVLYSGTARYNALGGAFGAVGADFSTLAVNPAGLGLYTASEVTFTMAPSVASASASYNGSTANDNRLNFGIGNLGLVISNNTAKGNNGILKSINIGIGLNRQNDFNNRVVIHGVNMNNSMMQSYANTLNQKKIDTLALQNGSDPFDLGLAYMANLIGYNKDTKQYFADAAYGGVGQDKTITTYGSMNEMDFSVAANFNDKVFVGLTLGIPSINFYESSLYQEYRVKDTIPNFIALNYRYDLHTHGTGVNLKVGFIYKPANWVRIGAAIHTPTWYPSLHDQYYSSMQSTFDNSSWNSTQYSPIGTYDYVLTTPFRAIGSLAFIIGQYGLISADYEYVNYSQAQFSAPDDNFSTVNNEISSSYKSWGNIRIGTEWRLSNLRLRGGFGYFSNPYQGQTNNSERYQVSGGLGYRGRHFFADLTYVWARMNQDYYLYDPSMVNPARITNHTNTILTTIGIRF